jgi:threonine dehydrogenase-like Zn-dependent dehydrogenase
MKTIYFDKNVPRILMTKLLRPIWPQVVWNPISAVRVEELEEPPLPGARWLRVRNIQCGICATDIALLNAQADPRIAGAAVPGIQRVYLGHEAVGEVLEAGPGVTRFKPGDRVVIKARPFGSPNCHTQEIDPLCQPCREGQSRFCENGSLGLGPNGVGAGWSDRFTAHESEVWLVPYEIDDDHASLIEPMAVAVHAVLRRLPQEGERALIVGGGIIGLLTLQALQALAPKGETTLLVRYPQQAEAAHSLGATHVIFEQSAYEKVADMTSARYYRAPFNRGMILGGYDLVYDCVGKEKTLMDSLRWARSRGVVILVGTSFGYMNFDLSPIYYQEVDLIGSNTFGLEQFKGREAHTFDIVMDLIRQGRMREAGLITHRYPFESYREAISVAADKRSGAIKVILTFPEAS